MPVKKHCCEFALFHSRRNTKPHLIAVIYDLLGRFGWLGLGPPTHRKTVGTPITPNGNLRSNLSNKSKRNLFLFGEGGDILHV